QLLWSGCRELVVSPDHDQPGRDLMAEILAAVKEFAPGLLVMKWLELPGLPPKGDIVDWLKVGGTKEALLALIEAAPVVTEPPAFAGPERSEPEAPGEIGPPPLIHLVDIERTQYVAQNVQADVVIAGVGETFHVPRSWTIGCDDDECQARDVDLGE